MRANVQRLESAIASRLSSRTYARLFALAGRTARLTSSTPRAVGVTQTDGFTSIRCTDGAIWTTDPGRIRVYSRGLDDRLGWLLKRYLGGHHLQADDVLLDVGANVGEFSIAAAPLVSHVVAVEPDPAAHRCLTRNVEDRNLDVRAVDAVLWKTEETLTFYSDPDDANSSVFGHGQALTREATTMDALCASLDLRPTVLKMDVEGAEPEVLEGASQTLKGMRLVGVDCGPERDGQPTHAEVSQILHDAGFDVQLHTSGPSRNIVTGVRPS